MLERDATVAFVPLFREVFDMTVPLAFRSLFPVAGFFPLHAHPGRSLTDGETGILVNSAGYPMIPEGINETAHSRWILGEDTDPVAAGFGLSSPTVTAEVDESGRGRNGGSGPFTDELIARGEIAILLTDKNIRFTVMNGTDRDGNRLARGRAVVSFLWPLTSIDEIAFGKDVIHVGCDDPEVTLGGADAKRASKGAWITGFRRKNEDFALALADVAVAAILASNADEERKSLAANVRRGVWDVDKMGYKIARFRTK